MTTKQLQKKIDKQREIIDLYLLVKHQKGDTVERIKIRGVQQAINNLVEYNILLEQECNK